MASAQIVRLSGALKMAAVSAGFLHITGSN
jgi:hypothetical protein